MEPVVKKDRMRKVGVRAGKLVLTVMLVAGLASCNSSEDPNLAWLLGLANGTSDTTSGEGNISEIPFSYEIDNIQQGTGDFVFETNKSIPVEILVEDPDGGVEGTRVLIRNPEGDRVLFRAVTKKVMPPEWSR